MHTGVTGTKKVEGGGQTIRYCHLSCKLKYAEALLMTRSCHHWQKVGGYAPPSQKVGGQLLPLFLPLWHRIADRSRAKLRQHHSQPIVTEYGKSLFLDK